MHFDEAEFAHWFLTVDGVINTYVVEKGDVVTDMISFYTLPSTVIGNEKYPKLNAAYSFYNVSTETNLTELMKASLILSKSLGGDVFNCLDIHDNPTFLEDLKFGPGDGNLQYYLYNWLCPPMQPNQMGMTSSEPQKVVQTLSTVHLSVDESALVMERNVRQLITVSPMAPETKMKPRSLQQKSLKWSLQIMGMDSTRSNSVHTAAPRMNAKEIANTTCTASLLSYMCDLPSAEV